MKPHKWAKEIHAWADGNEIEFRRNSKYQAVEYSWTKCETPMFDTNEKWEYRIKPQPKEPQYLYVFNEPKSNAFGAKQQVFITTDDGLYFGFGPIGKIKLEVDDEI